MASIVKEVADAIASELEQGSFSKPIDVRRKYIPSLDLRDVEGVVVTVVPRQNETTNADRSRMSNDVGVDVAVQRKVSGVNPADIDPLLDLVQEITDFLTRLRLAAVPSASWKRIVNAPIYAPDHLNGKQLFTSVIAITYVVHR